ncbi:MAG: hypothetical protein QOJ50_3878, partial [Cryptosporangiaceae bacterium]|nr:hypothetical protein [Cryptosporangiaceae bacterium]
MTPNPRIASAVDGPMTGSGATARTASSRSASPRTP